MAKESFVYVDLANDYFEGSVPLANPSVIERIIKGYGSIHDGLNIWCSSIKFHDGRHDAIVLSGVIKVAGKDEWKILLSMEGAEFLQASKKFQAYTLEDLFGESHAASFRKVYPELR